MKKKAAEGTDEAPYLMTVLEVAELISDMEAKLGVTAAAPRPPDPVTEHPQQSDEIFDAKAKLRDALMYPQWLRDYAARHGYQPSQLTEAVRARINDAQEKLSADTPRDPTATFSAASFDALIGPRKSRIGKLIQGS